MEQIYNLTDRVYISFENEVQELFLKKIKFIIEAMNFKHTYDTVLDFLTNNEKDEIENNIEILYSGAKALRFDGNNEYEHILVAIAENIDNEIVNILDIDNEIYGLKIIDRICHKNLSIYFDEEQENILFSFRFLDEHKYILIKDSKIVKDTSNDFYHILWLISVIGDCLFEFSEEEDLD